MKPKSTRRQINSNVDAIILACPSNVADISPVIHTLVGDKRAETDNAVGARDIATSVIADAGVQRASVNTMGGSISHGCVVRATCDAEERFPTEGVIVVAVCGMKQRFLTYGAREPF